MRSKKIKHSFSISKEDVKQSAYLLLWSKELDLKRNDEGRLVLELDDLEASSDASAWTTLSTAKRMAAQKVGRSRLTWAEESTNVWTATYDEKITE